MKIKRILPLFLALVMVLSTVVAVPLGAQTSKDAALATGADESIVGYKDENVVKITAETIAADGATSVTMTQFAAGSTSAKYVSINDADELVLFSDCSNSKGVNFSGKVIYLTANLDMTGKTMYPIAFRTQSNATYVNATAFRGTFDGQGYTISNLNMTMTSLADVLAKVEERWGKNYTTTVVKTTNSETQQVTETTYTANSVNGWGLFCYIDSDATIAGSVKNLRLDDTCHFETKQNGAYSGTGSIVGTVKNNNVRVTNCYSAATVIDKSTGSAGGIVGRGEQAVTLTNCTFAGDVTASNHAGGVVGYNTGGTFENCLNEGTVLSTGIQAGGMMARLDATATFTNCVNKGAVKVTADNDENYMAGFVGKVRKGTTLNLENCTNYYADFEVVSARSRIWADNFYNLTMHGGNVAVVYKNPTASTATVNATNCKGVELNAGYSADRIKTVGEANWGTRITKDTTELVGNTFYIDTPEGLLKLATLINESKKVSTNSIVNGKTIYITENLDMSDIDWMPIGTRANGSPSASGRAEGYVLDGLGHTISNLVCTPTYGEAASIGLFGISYSGVIRNLIMDSSCAFIAADAYDLASFADGHQYDTTKSDGQTTSNEQSAGAFLGFNGGVTIVNCQSSARVMARRAGGITGGGPAESANNGTFFCTNYGTIQGFAIGGGINGGIADSASTMNCVNYGTVHSQGWAAGITAGFRGGHQIRNNVNYGSVSCYIGGQCGVVIANNCITHYDAEIRNNYNHGALSTASNTSAVATDQGVVVATAENQFNAIASNTTTSRIWGNVNATPYIGYNASIIDRLSDDKMEKIPDVKDVWTIADGAATLNAAYTEAPKVLKITDKAGMRVLSAVVYFGNNLLGTTVYLANDIDMTGMIYDPDDLTFSKETTFLPIGHIDSTIIGTGDNLNGTPTMPYSNFTQAEVPSTVYTKVFSGTFDGQGYAVKNWTVTATDHSLRIGLFGVVHYGIVQNLVFDESNKMENNPGKNSSRQTGVVVQATYSLVNNVWNRSSWINDLTDGNLNYAGGIVALLSYANVTSCTNDGDLHGIRGVGGIVGWGMCSPGIANCRNNGKVSSTFRSEDNPTWIPSMNIAGGIVGFTGIGGNNFLPRLFNCVNNGEIEVCDAVDTNLPWAGSIVGKAVNMPQIRVFNVKDYANKDLPLYGQNKSVNTAANVFSQVNVAEGDAMLDDMLHTRYQAKATETVEGATVQDIRLVATVDAAANYKEAGFILTNAEGKQVKVDTTAAYRSFLAMTEGGEHTCNPEEYGACTSQYFFAYVLNNVAAGETIEAQSYVVTQDGTYLWGDVLTITVPTAVID